MIQLLQQLDLSHGCDRKALLIIVHLYHLECVKPVWIFVILYPGLEDLAKGALANNGLVNENLRRPQIQIVQLDALPSPAQI